MAMTLRRRVVRGVTGALVGLVIGLIASINVVIFGGIDGGYEATPTEVFDQNLFIGLLALAVLIAGPIVGMIVALRRPRTGSLPGA